MQSLTLKPFVFWWLLWLVLAMRVPMQTRNWPKARQSDLQPYQRPIPEQL